MRRQLAAALLGAALLTGGAQAVAEPPAARYVADEADVLSSETEQYIIDKNQSLFEDTGGEIVVVSVDFMDGMDAADYAMAVAESWGGIGDESLNNGFLLVYAVGENKVWAMAGSGIEDALPASKIEGWLEADFYGGYDAGEYDRATRAFFDDVYGWYESYYGTSAGTVVPSEPGRDFGYYPEPENDFVFAVVGQMVLFLLILLVVVVVCAADGWRYRRYRRRYLLPGMPPPPYVYRPFIFGRPHRPRPPRPAARWGRSASRPFGPAPWGWPVWRMGLPCSSPACWGGSGARRWSTRWSPSASTPFRSSSCWPGSSPLRRRSFCSAGCCCAACGPMGSALRWWPPPFASACFTEI